MSDTKRKTYEELKSIMDKRTSYMLTDTSDVNDAYIKAFDADWQNYYNGLQGAYDNLNWGNATTTYEAQNKVWQDLSERANKIGAYYYQNRNRYGNDAYTSIDDYISQIQSGGANIIGNFKSMMDFYNRFESQDVYDSWQADQDFISDITSREDYQANKSLGEKQYNQKIWDDMRKVYDDNTFSIADWGENKSLEEWGKEIWRGMGTASLAQDTANLIGDWNSFSTMKEQLSDDELGVYYYLLATDPTKAEEYFRKYADTANQRKASGVYEKINNNLGETGTAFLSGIESFGSGFNNALSALYGKDNISKTTVNQYASAFASQDNDETFGRKVLQVANDLAQTLGNQLPSIGLNVVAPGAGLVTMGVSAAGNAYAEMKQIEGISETQAIAYGVTIGVLEATLQKFIGGISGLGSDGGIVQNAVKKALPNITNGFARAVVSLGANMADEGIEEAAQTALEPIMKHIFSLGEEPMIVDWNDPNALEEFGDYLGEIAYSGFLGALSAGFIEGGFETIPNSVSISKSAKKQYGNVTNDLVSDILAKDPNNKLALAMQKRIDSGKKVSGLNIAELVKQGDATAISSAITQKLNERGETSDITKLSELLTKEAMGEELTRAEKKLIKSSDFGRSIQGELNPESLSSDAEMDRWAEKIGTRETNAKEYNKQVQVKSINEDGTVELENGKSIKAEDVTLPNESDDLIFKIATERVSRVDGWTNETANAMIKGYDGKVTATAYRKAYISAFEMGKNGEQTSQIVALADQIGIKGSTLLAAYDMGMQATEKALTNSTEGGKIESEVNTDESTGLRLRDSSKRNGSKDSQKQVSGVEESTGRDTSREDTERKVADSEAVKLVNEGRKVKVSELGILNGSKTQTVTVVDKSQETTEMKRARKEAEKRGLKVRFFLGDNLVIEENSELISVRGYIKGEYVFVRADHPLYTSYQLMRHEIGHDMIAKGEVDINKVRAKLEETVGKENIDMVADMYAEAYKNSGKDADAIWEECICDSLGDMNVFSKFADIDQGIITMMLGDIKQATEDTKTAPNKTRGAPDGKASGEIDYAEYNKPITLADVEILRSIGRKSINKFTAEEIKKAQKWAYKFYQELKTKSPFFRAWFGEWRAHQRDEFKIDKIETISINNRNDGDVFVKQGLKNQTLFRGNVNNSDTKFKINIGAQVYNDTLTYANRTYSRTKDFDHYKARLTILNQIRDVVKNSIYFDTSIIDDKDNPNRTFMHYFYKMYNIGNKNYLVKLGVDEINSNNGEIRRAYNVNNIEISPIAVSQVYKPAGTMDDNGDFISTISISDFYELVKTFDKEFTPAPEVDKVLLNEDGTPKKFYHGTDAKFTEFKPEEMSHKEGSYFFAENREDAEAYGKNIHEVYLTGRKLADYDNQPSEFYKLRDKRKQVEWLKERGYDGWYADMDSGGWGELSVFSPEQIKSAKGNIGTFSKYETDTKYSRDLSIEGDGSVETKPLSNRELLANALLDTVQHEVEYTKLMEYKSVIDNLEAKDIELAKLKNQIREATFGNGDKTKLKELKEKARKTEANINFYDKKLLQLESTQALKNVLERAKKKAYSKALAKGRETLHANVEGRHKTIERNRIKDIAHELDKLLNKGTKKRNVKIGAQPIVSALLDITDRLMATDDELIMSGIVTETNSVEEDALGKYRELYDELHSTDDDVTNHKEERKALRQEMNEVKKELSDLLTRERKRISKAKASDSMQTLINEYHKLENAEEDYLKLAYKQKVYEHLVSLKDNLGDKLVSEMSLDDLKDLHKACTMIYKMVTSSNKLFREGKYQNIKDIVDPIFKEISDIVATEKDVAKMVGDVKNIFAKLRWDNLRPVDAFENIGSETLTRLYWDAIDAQDKYGAAVMEIGDAIINARKKYGYKKWDINKTQTFKTADGNFQITLGEMMSIYAYSKRKQADKHMREGGFTHEKNASYKDKNGRIILRHDAKRPYRLGDKSLVDISSALTAQQKEYVDTIVEFMTKYGEKGNEVSRIMYGIDLFTETWYFPLKSSADFLPSATDQMGKVQTTASLSNIGMTKATVPNANNPIVLRSFDDVVFEHLDSMAKYNAYVIPIDNLRKVFDSYDSNTNMALKSLIRSNIGQAAEEYLKKYITDLNGGIVTEQGSLDKVMKVFSNTKAATVLANTSVWIQQFFSIIRAATLLHPKYFIPYMGNSYKNPNNLKIYEEMKRYAPITVIKEMGGFDVGSNKGLSSYIGYNESKFTMGKFMSKVNDVFGIGASLMDKVGWITIWKVVKKEVASTGKFKEGSDAYFEACRKRMNEVITKTQVYDSVNSRSAHMRNKSSLAKMLTSYMGEPTVIVGMLDTAFTKVKRALVSKDDGKIKQASSRLATTLVWVTISTAMTSIMKSIPYANRDDDEDETWWEKYFEALASSFAQDLNLMNYIPLFRDISSIVNGFTVERGDMQAIADAINDVKKLLEDTNKDTESWDTTWTEVVKVVGSVSTLFRIPARNIMRELEAIKNTVDTIGRKYNSDIGGAFKQGFSSGDFIGSLITGEDGKTSKSEKLYSAFVRGDTERLDYYKSTYEDEKSYESALRKSLRDNDPRVEQAALARLNRDNNTYYNLMMDIIDEGIFSRAMVKEAFEAEYNYQKRLKEEAEK